MSAEYFDPTRLAFQILSQSGWERRKTLAVRIVDQAKAELAITVGRRTLAVERQLPVYYLT